MAKILLIETATCVCSVSLADRDKIISKRETFIDRTHAKLLAPFIKEILDETGFTIKNLDAIAVSMGPGSYTGLRIGISMAKGLCYASGLPLVAVPTLEAMAFGLVQQIGPLPDSCFLCPVLDARRMEIYTAVYSKQIELLEETSALVVERDTFNNHFEQASCYLFGSGAEKLKPVLAHKNLMFYDNFVHSSVNMAVSAFNRFTDSNFVDVAYFEPFYLKEFMTTTPKNKFF